MRVDAVNNNRQFYRFADFRGVDYSSSPLEVQSNRATDMANLILRDGTLHKRNGFEQLHYLGGTEEIQGAWLMKRFASKPDGEGYKDYEVDVLIYIQGNKVKEYNITDSVNTILEEENSFIRGEAIGFVSKNDLYILCGTMLHVKYGTHGFDVYDLCDGNRGSAYIPLTTKNIVCEGSQKQDKERLLVDPINELTDFRRNQIVWESGITAPQYKLDSECAVLYDENNVKNYPKLYIDGKEVGTFITTDNTPKLVCKDTYKYKDYLDGAIITDDIVSFPTSKTSSSALDDKEIIIEFPVAIPFHKSLTVPATVGAIFGNDGRSDRLFIATGNFVRYTENTADYLPNFTYLPVTNFVRCGSAGKVTAMMRLADGRLAVFKDSENDQEPSLYYIAGKTIEADTDVPGVVAYNDLFTVQAGNIEEKCPTPNAIATLAGDSLFVSPSGVYGIELSGNVAADDRFARERSRIINTKLTKFDLTKAKAIVYDNRYYLAVGGEHNEVYIADSRYKYTAEGDLANTFNYEWFRWTDVPVASWLIKDNELWFISKDNYLCRFTNEYSDKYLTSQGEETLKNKRVTFHPSLLPIVEKALYAEYNDERYAISNISQDENGYGFDIELAGDGVIELSFIVPVKAYWKSSVTALGSSIHRKNMYSLSVVVQPAKQSEVSVGYTTRLRDRVGMNAEGTNAFDFCDISFEEYGGYQFFSFDAGGFISAYRQRVFERNFVYAQLFFACNSIGDCIVEEMSVEYTLTRKNIGVG